jgi:hypothetical protein
MPDRDRLTCERWLLRCELAEIREQAVEHRRRAAWWEEGCSWSWLSVAPGAAGAELVALPIAPA